MARKFSLLIIGRTATVFADQMIELLILWFIWDLTKSSTATGVASFAGRAPFWLFAFYGATLVDRFGPLRLLAYCNAAAAGIAAVVTTKLFLFGPDFITLVALAFTLNSTRSLEAAALAAAVPALESKPDRHQAANSWFDNAKRLGRLTAPLLSRWMGVIHPAAFVMLAALAYGGMAGIAARLSRIAAVSTRPPQVSVGQRAAFAFVKGSRPLRLLIGLSAVYAFFHGIAYFIVLPRLSFELEPGSPSSFGAIITLFGIGGLLSNLIIARISIPNHSVAVGCGMMAIGLCFALFAASPPWEFRLALALVAGASLPFQDIFITCAIQALGPSDLVARLHATWRLACEITISAGLLLGGLAADFTSASFMGLASGVLIILTGGLLALSRERPSPPESTRGSG